MKQQKIIEASEGDASLFSPASFLRHIQRTVSFLIWKLNFEIELNFEYLMTEIFVQDATTVKDMET